MPTILLMFLIGMMIITIYLIYSNKNFRNLDTDDIKMREIVKSTIKKKDYVMKVDITDKKNENSYTMEIEIVLNNGFFIIIKCDKNNMIIQGAIYRFTPNTLSEHLSKIIIKQVVLELKKAII